MTIQEKLESISRGLQLSGNDLWYFISFIVLLTAGIIIVYLVMDFLEKHRLRKWAGEKYQLMIREFDLTIREMDLLDQMAVFLINPLKKYLLLQNRGTYSSVLRQLSLVRKIPEEVERSLAEKLGFPYVQYTKQLHSTLDISRAVPVAVADSTGNLTLCLSEGHSTGRLSLKTIRGTVKLKPGMDVTLYVYTYRYLYLFETKVFSVDKDSFSVLEVDTAVLDADSRKKKLELPVYITPESLNYYVWQTEIVRIIKGGAIIRNPDKSIRKGDDIKITFHPVYAKNYHLNCEVLKVSKNKKYIYTVFSHIKRREL